MKLMDRLLLVVEAAAWYFFFFYLVFSIKMPVNLYYSSLILLALFYIASVSCPWLRNTDAWKKMWKGK